MYRELIGKNLKFIMNEKGVSFTSLSKITNISRDHLYNIVNGSKEIGIDTFEKICLSLSVTPDRFFLNHVNLNEIDMNVLSDFKNMSTDVWNFSNVDTSHLIHGLHNYPAVMIWPISNLIINTVTKYKKVSNLLDPFVGSGTVAVEGQRSNINVYANDLNPLAMLITKAKTTIMNNEDFVICEKIILELKSILQNNINVINDFVEYVETNFDIITKGENWSVNAPAITNNYFEKTVFSKLEIPDIPNLGFWFRPESIISIEIIKNLISKYKTATNEAFLLTTLSEVIRLVSNTRNGEFKLYRKSPNVILNKKHDVLNIFIKCLNKNLNKEQAYINSLESNSNNVFSKVKYMQCNAQNLTGVEDESIDLVITSPPYGDSATTVAYGQYSKLSNIWLGLTNENIDSKLLGGKKIKDIDLDRLGSPTLVDVYNKISAVDQKRAIEVASFYFELDSSIKEISRTVKSGGYQFWVVGNRTVKLVNIQTDVIIEELARKYGVVCLDKYYRSISNKVMPSVNSPTNVVGEHVNTMTSEIILFLKKN